MLSISAPDFLINKTIWSDILGRFDDSYLISFAEPDGQWSINILAADRDANEGKANFVKKFLLLQEWLLHRYFSQPTQEC